eukprot:761161-Hanusia_phi.AAC.9
MLCSAFSTVLRSDDQEQAHPLQNEASLKIVIKKQNLLGLKINTEHVLAQVIFVLSPKVQYRARVVHGSLGYDNDEISFMMGEGPSWYPLVNHLTLTNMFKVPIYIYSVDVQSEKFQVEFEGVDPLLKPKQTSSPIRLTLTDATQPFLANLCVGTSLMVFRIPLRVFHGKLELDEADRTGGLGIIGVNQNWSKMIDIRNPNPIPISVLEIQSGQQASFEISVENSNSSDLRTCLYNANTSEYGRKGSKSNHGNVLFAIGPNDHLQIHLSAYSTVVESVRSAFIMRWRRVGGIGTGR